MQKKFEIDSSFKAIFPESCIGVLVVRGMDNSSSDDKNFTALLNQGIIDCQRHIAHPEFAENPIVAQWREAYRQFKTKKGVRSSIEALLKRVKSENPPGSINPLVDLYNYISLKYGLPCGGEDTDCIEGNLRLTVAQGGEGFLPLGADAEDPALSGEVVYKDDVGAICRCFNWREAQRTMLTEKTINAILCIELLSCERFEELEKALAELEELVIEHLGGSVQKYVLCGADIIEI